jgi:hypothetical protein
MTFCCWSSFKKYVRRRRLDHRRSEHDPDCLHLIRSEDGLSFAGRKPKRLDIRGWRKARVRMGAETATRPTTFVRHQPHSVSVCRRQTLNSSMTRRLRRRERIEMNAIAMKAMRCSFERSTMVFNRQ